MNEVQAEMVEELIEAQDELTDWEAQFVDNLYNKYDDRILTTSQDAQLRKLHKQMIGE